MKTGIHPAYVETTVVCGCGNSFQTRSTKESGHIVVEVCSQCHPFYTGKQKILDSGGRVARFEKRYGKRPGSKQTTEAPEADATPAESELHHRRPSLAYARSGVGLRFRPRGKRTDF